LKRITQIVFVSMAATIVLMVVAAAAGFRVNRTASMPRGLWLVSPIRTHSYERGDKVEVCPPLSAPPEYVGAGNCPGGKEPLFKVVAAAATDAVDLSAEGIAVNGILLPETKPLERDGRGRQLTPFRPGHYAVSATEVWVVANVPASFDSRYFGPLPVSAIRGAARPILTWP
jgi:conjugative transfer signal peptidase TraF